MTRLGVVADTHDLLRPELLTALAGVDVIVHAGDVCTAPILEALAEIAPVHAVRGNNDAAPFADTLPEALALRVANVDIWMCHDATDLRRLPPPAGTRLVITGHSHRPRLDVEDGVTHLNPGSPGRRRFSLPVSCAIATIENDEVHCEIITLDVPPARRRRTP